MPTGVYKRKKKTDITPEQKETLAVKRAMKLHRPQSQIQPSERYLALLCLKIILEMQ